MMPPPSPCLVRKVSPSPRMRTIQSMTTCSSSVQAGEQIHYSVSTISLQLIANRDPEPWLATYVEARVADARGVQLAEHALERANGGKVRKESAMLPVGDTFPSACSPASGLTRQDQRLKVCSDGLERFAVNRRRLRQGLDEVPRLDLGFDWAAGQSLVVRADGVHGGISLLPELLDVHRACSCTDTTLGDTKVSRTPRLNKTGRETVGHVRGPMIAGFRDPLSATAWMAMGFIV